MYLLPLSAYTLELTTTCRGVYKYTTEAKPFKLGPAANRLKTLLIGGFKNTRKTCDFFSHYKWVLALATPSSASPSLRNNFAYLSFFLQSFYSCIINNSLSQFATQLELSTVTNQYSYRRMQF